MIYSIGPSPKDVNLIWAGTDDGLIHVTRDGGKSWQNVTPPELGAWNKVSQIDASHFDPLTAYASVSRFRLDDLTPLIFRTHDGGKSWQKITSGLPEGPVNVVREDPERKGLLFAGSEGAVSVSFDDGEHWQPLQLNLPATSMRDLVIHGDDLVVGTHGRGFWILDDITPLRQIDARTASLESHLFAPQQTYRVRSRQYTDTPLPPEIPAAKNPPDGAVIDYWLKSPATAVSIEVRDSAGKLVRRFSSDDKAELIDHEKNDPKINVPQYWVRPVRLPATEPGMHRFVWDLRYPSPKALDRDYPISAIFGDTPREPLGPMVVPGRYAIALTANGKTLTQPLTIKMDPRIKVSDAELRQQLALENQLVAGMERSFDALQQVKELRAQLKALTSDAQIKGGDPLAAEIAALDAKAAALEADPSLGTPDVGAPISLTRSHHGLEALYSAVAGVDAAPTAQQVNVSKQVLDALEKQLAAWDEIVKRYLPALNQSLRQAERAEVTVTAP